MPESNITKRVLASTLKELVTARPFEKVSVSDICDACGVSRKTFYYHFQDKYELLEWIIMTELLEPIRPLIQNGMVDQALVLLFSSLTIDPALGPLRNSSLWTSQGRFDERS